MIGFKDGVLVADAHPLMRGGMVSILASDLSLSGVIGVDNFEGVLRALAQHPNMGLLLVDSELPGMEGMQGLRRIRLQRPKLRVALMATRENRADAFEAFATGVHGYLPKDVTASVMADALKLILSGQIYLPPIMSNLSLETDPPAADRGGRDLGELTQRQREVITHLAAGMSNREIARTLNIAQGTVKVHVTAAFRALNVHNRAGAAVALLKLQSVEEGGQQELPGLGVLDTISAGFEA